MWNITRQGPVHGGGHRISLANKSQGVAGINAWIQFAVNHCCPDTSPTPADVTKYVKMQLLKISVSKMAMGRFRCSLGSLFNEGCSPLFFHEKDVYINLPPDRLCYMASAGSCKVESSPDSIKV